MVEKLRKFITGLTTPAHIKAMNASFDTVVRLSQQRSYDVFSVAGRVGRIYDARTSFRGNAIESMSMLMDDMSKDDTGRDMSKPDIRTEDWGRKSIILYNSIRCKNRSLTDNCPKINLPDSYNTVTYVKAGLWNSYAIPSRLFETTFFIKNLDDALPCESNALFDIYIGKGFSDKRVDWKSKHRTYVCALLAKLGLKPGRPLLQRILEENIAVDQTRPEIRTRL